MVKKNKIGECLTKLQPKRLIAVCALFALYWSCLEMNWPHNLSMTNIIIYACVMLLHRLLWTSMKTNIKLRSIFFYNFFEWLSLTPQFSALTHWVWQFLNTEISQGSVGTRLMCVRMFNNNFIANSLMSLSVKEFWKLVSIWQSYGQKSSVLFFWFSDMWIWSLNYWYNLWESTNRSLTSNSGQLQ